LANLAGCYSETISTLSPRIVVLGEHGHLSNPDVANTVRALLLAAIRSAVLWRQCGGNRLQLLFGRRKLIAEAQRLLSRV
jgi:high frequency lysogenization protein